MKNSQRLRATCVLSLVCGVGVVAGADDLATLRRQAVVAYRAGDWKGFLENATKAAALRPDHPGLLYNVACARSLNGDAAGAIEALDQLAERKIDLGGADDPDLDLARKSPGFERVAAKLAALHRPIGAATVAFELPDRDLCEGIALDPTTGSMFVGSVHGRRIVRHSAAGQVTPFTSEPLLAVFGMAVDAKRRLLWAATSVLPEMKDYRKELDGTTELVAFDLDTGKVVQRRAPPDDGRRHSLNDVAVSPKGDVFVSDSVGGVLYRLARGGTALETFVAAGTFGSPNGLAFTKDGKSLYVADYATTVFRIDLPTKKGVPVVPARLPAPPGAATIGIDGLVWHHGALVAIQNGITPHRVVRLRLSPRGDAIDSAEILLMNDARFDEPTLGVVSKDALLLVANSHWGRFDAKTGTFPSESVTPTMILKLPL